MNKKQLIRHINEYLQITGFRAKGTGPGVVSLVREQSHLKEELLFPYKKYYNGYVLGPCVLGWKTFTVVENILQKYYLKNNINYRAVTIHCESRREEQLYSMRISSVEELGSVLPILKEMANEDVLSFFAKYQLLEDVHNNIKQLQVNELAKFVTNPPHSRIMIIKRLVASEDWNTYCESVMEIYRKGSEGRHKALFAPIYNFLPELYDELISLDVRTI